MINKNYGWVIKNKLAWTPTTLANTKYTLTQTTLTQTPLTQTTLTQIYTYTAYPISFSVNCFPPLMSGTKCLCPISLSNASRNRSRAACIQKI